MPLPLDARHIANQTGDFAPQHANHWTIEIAGLDGDDRDLIEMSIMTGALPTETNEVIEMKYGNETIKVAGAVTVESIPLVVRDYVDRDIRGALIRWRRQVYDAETGLIGLPSEYKKSASVIVYASNNTKLRKCRLIGLWPSALNEGTLDQSSSEPIEIEMTLEFDRHVWSL